MLTTHTRVHGWLGLTPPPAAQPPIVVVEGFLISCNKNLIHYRRRGHRGMLPGHGSAASAAHQAGGARMSMSATPGAGVGAICYNSPQTRPARRGRGVCCNMQTRA